MDVFQLREKGVDDHRVCSDSFIKLHNPMNEERIDEELKSGPPGQRSVTLCLGCAVGQSKREVL